MILSAFPLLAWPFLLPFWMLGLLLLPGALLLLLLVLVLVRVMGLFMYVPCLNVCIERIKNFVGHVLSQF